VRIDDIRAEAAAGRHRVVARVTWEDCEREAQDIYFQTNEEFAPALTCRPEAFLAACLPPALWSAERRIRVDGDVCPEMLDNVRVVNNMLEHWFHPVATAVSIEAPTRRRAAEGRRRAGLFFSGGLDSIAALCGNREDTHPGHPAYVKDGILVYGLEVEEALPFELVVTQLQRLAREARLTLIPVATNLRSLNPDWAFWFNGYNGGALSAVGHALGGRLSSVVIASDYQVRALQQHGSHPLVGQNFSSYDLKIRYADVTLRRIDKARRVARWAPALQNLRVCNRAHLYAEGTLNCGDCEKCVRTMLDFLVIGALDRLTAIPRRELTRELILSRCYMKPSTLPYYDELIGPLRAVGRGDLAEAVDHLVRVARCQDGWKGRLRRFDRERLNGYVWTLRRSLRASWRDTTPLAAPSATRN